MPGTTSVRISSCLPRSRSETHRLDGEGHLLPVVLDDVVDDRVEVVVDLVVVVEDDLGVDLDLESSHYRLLPLPRGDCRPLSVWRNRLRVISYITRDEVSTAKET